MTAQTVETHAAPILGDLAYRTEPAGLSGAEAIAYRAGYTRGARAYAKKTGGPVVVHNGDAPAPGSAARKMLGRQLAERGRAYRVECHPIAHKAGMTALRSYLRKIGATDRLGEIVDPCAPVKSSTRKPASTRKASARIIPAPEPVETPAPVVEPVTPATVADPMPRQTHAAKKASNRELAEAMRAAGVKITPDTWAAAKSGALPELARA